MKNKIFSRGLYVEGLRQLRLSGIIIFVLATVINMITPIGQLLSYKNRISTADYEFQPQIVEFAEIAPTIFYLAILVAPILTFILFGSFNRRNASDFYHSMPYTRLCVFFSFSAAIITWLLAIELVSTVIPLIFCAVLPDIFILSLVGLFDTLLTLFICSIIIIFSVICGMSISGTTLSNIVSSALFMFLPRFIIFILTFPIGSLTPIIEGHYGILSSNYNVFVNLILTIFDMGGSYNDMFIGNIKQDIYSLFVALIYIALAAILFIRRKSETAGNSAEGRKTQATVRISIGFILSSIATVLLLSGNTYFDEIWPLYLFAIIVYFVYEAVTQKTLKKLYKAIPGLAIVLVLNLSVIGICLTSRSIIHTYTPAASDVSSVYLVSTDSNNYYYDSISFSEYAAENASKIKIENKQVIDIVTKALEENNERSKDGSFHSFRWEEIKEYSDFTYKHSETNYIYLTVRFVSNGGISRYRNLYITEDEYNSITEEISKIDEYKQWYTKIPEALDRTIYISYQKNHYIEYPFTNETNKEILEVLRKELTEINLSQWISYVSTNGNNGSYTITYRPENMQTELYIPLDESILPKTTEAIFNEAVNLNRDKAEEFPELLDELISGEDISDKYDYLYISIGAYDGTAVWSFNIGDYSIHEMIELTEAHDSDKNFNLTNNSAAKLKEKIEELSVLLRENKDTEISPEKYIFVRVNGNLKEGTPYFEHIFYLPYLDDFTPEQIPNIMYIYEEETSEMILVD